ncbi:unnamed protein product, partial [Onchocerca ochengi]|uniref:Uncharacterized protein n=1 Tax=Onchocerca ochengi TaxID=42157 RepID=A0A182E873_ONCOC
MVGIDRRRGGGGGEEEGDVYRQASSHNK